MNLLTHSIAQGPVDALVTHHATGALELGGHDGCEEMSTVTFHLEMLADDAFRNEALHVGRGGVGHAGDYLRRTIGVCSG